MELTAVERYTNAREVYLKNPNPANYLRLLNEAERLNSN